MGNAPNSLSEIMILLCILIVPATLSYLLIIQWMKFVTRKDPEIKELHGTNEFVKYIFSLDTSKSLSSQGLFWLSILVPVMYFIAFGSVAWWGYSLRLDAEGFKTFISISPLPLGLLSLAFPISASVARFHTTKQTAKQISIVSHKNNVDLYHAHRKELFTYFDQIGEYEYHENLIAKNIVHPRMHKIFFKGAAKDGIPSIDVMEFYRVEAELASTRKVLTLILNNSKPNDNFSMYLGEFSDGIYRLSNMLGLPEVLDLMSFGDLIPAKRNREDVLLNTVGTSSDEAIGSFKYAENFFHNLCDFANYNSPYFKNNNARESFDSGVKVQLRMPEQARVIESLHRIEITQALNERNRNKQAMLQDE